ncbi:MAG: cyclic-di-GMP phosphodiesterase [Methanobacterium sp. PtaB.Bin024]|nr:MAG: cyclic-di-GMP phosphodiesterase [Methanobacterium sp. PtaB.Bin024]
MTGNNILLVMNESSESSKIKEILSAANFNTVSISEFKKNYSLYPKGYNTHNNQFDFKYANINTVDLILMDESFVDESLTKNKSIQNRLKELHKKTYIPTINITSNSDDTPIGSFDSNIIYLKKPFKPRELLLTLKLATIKYKTENALYESEDKYRLLIENADDPIAMINYNGEFVMVNHSAARFFGCKRENFQGKTMWEVFPKEYADSQMENIRNVLDRGEGQVFEGKTIIRGKEHCFRTNIQPMPIKNGGMKMVQLIAHDITPLKQAGEALQKSEKKFREVFNNANDGVSIHSIEEDGLPGKFYEVNDVVCKRLGYTREELLEMGPKDVISHETLQKMPKFMEKLHSEGKTIFEAVQITKSGAEIITEITNHLFSLQGKEMVTAISRDISERKKAQTRLLRILAGIEAAEDSISISKPDGCHFYHNQSFNELFGYSVEELNVPLGPVQLFADEDLGNHIFQTIMGGGSWDGELEMIDKAGRIFPAFIRANAIKNHEDQVIGLIGVLNDITERKRVEYALKTSEEKFRNLAETAVDAIIILDIDEKVVFCNRSLERIFDYSEEEIIGEYFDTLIPKSHVEDFQLKLDYHHQSGYGNVFESFGMRKDGSEFPLEMSLNTWETEGETYTTFIIRDITQRKLNEFKMKMREEIFQLMSENIDEVFWLIDPLTGQILYMSPSYQKIWGETIENLYQNPRSWIESIHPHDKDKFISYIFGKNGNSQHREGIECRVIRHDTDQILIRVRAFPVINQNKEIYRRIGIATDITGTRTIEDK